MGFGSWGLAQQASVELAEAYVAQGLEREAIRVYEAVLEQRFLASTHQDYFKFLMHVGAYGRAEKHIKKYRKRRPEDVSLVSDWIFLLHAQESGARVDKALGKAMRSLSHSPALLLNFAHLLLRHKLHAEALRVYKQARRLKEEPALYSSTIAQLHLLLGNRKAALEEYLVYLQAHPHMNKYVLEILRNHFRHLEDQEVLQKDLLALQRKRPNNLYLFELSIGMALYREAFDEAFFLAKLFHKRQPISWKVFVNIATQAFQATRYEVAWEVYEYMVSHYTNHVEVVVAQYRILEIKEALLAADLFHDTNQAAVVATAYLAFASKHPTKRSEAMHKAALLYGRYLARPDTAIVMMEGLLKEPLRPALRDQIRLDLGDLYLMTSRPWQAMLWYIQAEKNQLQGLLREKAKLNIAKVSLYQGEVTLAKAQLNILATATSQRVANDALELLRMVQLYQGDSLVLQAVVRAQEYAHVFSYDSLVQTLEGLLVTFPDHAGRLFTRYVLAEALIKQGHIDEGLEQLTLLQDEEAFFADKILWLRARLMEESLELSDQALALYVQLIKTYPQSLLIPRARARVDALGTAL